MGNYEAIFSEFASRGLVSQRLKNDGGDGVRTALTRALLDAQDWAFWMPHVMPTPKGKFDIVISAAQYLEMVSRRDNPKATEKGQPYRQPDMERTPKEISRLIVDGDVVIARGWAEKLPRAIIRGMLQLSGCPKLGEVNLTVLGGASIEDCPSLTNIEGEYFVDMNIARCGTAKLGANLRVHRNLTVSECDGLEMVNCACDGRFVARKCPNLTHSGPAFCVGKAATIETCGALHQLKGRVGKLILGYDIGEVDRSRLTEEDGAHPLAIGIAETRSRWNARRRQGLPF